jgi:rhodanese-related sulfurtransferase
MVTTASITELQEALICGGRVLDVREKHEFDGGHVPNAINIPMSVVPLRIDDVKGFNSAEPIWVICESGARSWQVAEYLTRHGLSAINVDGGTSAWRASGLSLEK